MPYAVESAVDILQANPELVIGAVRDHPEDHLAAGFEVRGRPINPLYTADDLNDFLEGLMPDFPSDMNTDMDRYLELETGLRIGSLLIRHGVQTPGDDSSLMGVWTRLRVYPDEVHLEAATRRPVINLYRIPKYAGELVTPEPAK